MADAEAATRNVVDILVRRDLDAVSSAVADDYVDHQGLDEAEIRGPDGFRRVVEAVHRASDVRITIESMVAAEDHAAVLLLWRGVDPDGHEFTRKTLELLRFANGRLAEHWGVQLFYRRS